MKTTDFLSYLRNLDVKVYLEGDRLRVNGPKGAITPDIKAELAERKPEIIEFIKSSNNLVTDDNRQSIKQISREKEIPLSSAQLRLWFLEQLEPGSSSAYNISRTLGIRGKLNRKALEQSIGEIVRRHECLRTNFATSNGQPHQGIKAHENFSLAIEELEEVPISERRGKALELATAMARRKFDLTGEPLYQFKLFCLDPSEHLLQVVMHHMVSDGWSIRLFQRELTALYEACCQGIASPLAPLPIQYADYAYWQQEWLKGEQYQEQLAYWKRVLGGSLPVLELPTDYPRPRVQTYRGAREELQLEWELSDKLKQLSQKEGVTLAMTMLAAFKTLLYRHSLQEDIIVGTPLAGRNQVEVEGLIGFFISTLVLRADLSGNPSFSQLLKRIRSCTLEAYAHQEMPFEKLVEELQPERDMSRSPIFQVWFNMQNLGEDKLELSGLTVESLSREEVQSKFDLTLYVKELKEGIKCEFVYNADLFARERIAQMAEQLQYLLMQVADNPEAKIAHLSLVTPAAQRILPDPLSALNSVWEGAVHTHFSQQARRVPQRLAVVDAQMAIGYGELNARSNQLARYLLANGIGSQDIVAIYAHRSAALVWALLGVLKAGAAFVILDPAYPSSRLRDCLGIAAPRGWLQLAAAAPQPGPQLLEAINELPLRLELPADIMATVPELLPYETDDPAVTVAPDDLAYVAFTSGSTGKPKGIAGTHKPLSHFLGWHTHKFGLTEGERFSMLSGLSHDPLLRDIFTPLWVGATLYIPSQEDIETPGQLAHWMEGQQISVTHLTPAMGQLLRETSSLILPQLRYGFFGGDRLTPQDLAGISKLAPEVTCVNFYGATETPQAMGYFICPKSSDQSQEFVGGPSIPIGRGIADVQLLVLNSQQQLAGIGEVGEVYVRTPYLAKGYVGAEEMTQERFGVNPLTKMAGDMLYRTGDLARYLPDGNIVFQGRADNQVKIRGFRIETGEIVAVLTGHPAVASAVALARALCPGSPTRTTRETGEDRPGDKGLVAYVVLHQEQKEAVTVDELRQLVKQKLPSYMVPSAFVLLETLPLTANGKVDRRALPAPERNLASSAETFVAPEDELERQLVEIWQSVLGVDPIGVKDDFFELGGHSLLAVTLFSEIEKVTKRKLPLATLFQAPTIAELGKIIRSDGWSAPWSPLVAIQPNGTKPPVFFIHAVGGNVLSYRELAINLGQDQPVYGLQAEGLDGQKQSLSQIEYIAANYTKAMRHLQPEGPYYLGGYSFGGMVAFEIAQQLYAQGQEVALLVLLDTREPSLRPTFKSWLSFHVKNLIQLEPQEKLNYIKVKTGLGVDGNWDLIEALRQMYRRNTTRKGRRLYNPPEAQIRPYEQIVESNRKAYSSYAPQPLPGRVTLIRAKMGSASVHADPEGGWGKVALKGVEVHEVPGDHISIFQQPKVQVLAETLKACIDKAIGNQ